MIYKNRVSLRGGAWCTRICRRMGARPQRRARRLNGANNSITELFEWDPTEPVATRPMFMQYRVPGQTYALFYTHDGNKNVSEVVHFSRANGVAAHYEYAPFGEVTAQVRRGGVTAYDFSAINPWRFSSEYADDALACDYYNYRHYEIISAKWLTRDSIEENGGTNLYQFLANESLSNVDDLGNQCCIRIWDGIPGHMALKCDNGLYVSKYPDQRKPTSRPPKLLDEKNDIKHNGNGYTDICMSCVDESKSANWWKIHKSENYNWQNASCIEAALGALSAGVAEETKPPCKCEIKYAILGFYPYIRDNLSREVGVVPYSTVTPNLLKDKVRSFSNGCKRYECVYRNFKGAELNVRD